MSLPPNVSRNMNIDITSKNANSLAIARILEEGSWFVSIILSEIKVVLFMRANPASIYLGAKSSIVT